jgi:hypothetical protein
VLAQTWVITLWRSRATSDRRSLVHVTCSISMLRSLGVSRVVYVIHKLFLNTRLNMAAIDATVTTLPYAASLMGHAMLSQAFARQIEESSRRSAVPPWRGLDERARRRARRRAGQLAVNTHTRL